MSAQAQGIPIQFNAQTDPNGFFVPVFTGITDPDNVPLTAFQIKTVPQKSLLFNITGSISGLNVGFGGSTSTSGSVQLLKAPNPQPTNNFIRETDYTVLGSTIFISASSANITNGSGQFNFSATGSVEFNDLLYLRVIGFTNTTVPRDPSEFTASLHSFRITSEPTGSAKELVVEPYLTSPFYGTDCDVTYGNASQPVINPFLQDIDYDSGGIIPTNNQAIIDGTAVKGTTPESFFTMGNIINPTFKSVNTTTRYNVNKSSYSSQTSAGTFTVYYSSNVSGVAAGTGRSFAFFDVNYIINNNNETFEISNSDNDLDFLKRLFIPANPIPLGIGQSYPPPTNPIHTRAIPFLGTGSSAATDEPASFNGRIKVVTFGSIVKLLVYNSGSSAVTVPSGGGIIFPSDIELTSASDLPSRSRKVLTEANILSPESLG